MRLHRDVCIRREMYTVLVFECFKAVGGYLPKEARPAHFERIATALGWDNDELGVVILDTRTEVSEHQGLPRLSENDGHPTGPEA